jgi:hypothetical protein
MYIHTHTCSRRHKNAPVYANILNKWQWNYARIYAFVIVAEIVPSRNSQGQGLDMGVLKGRADWGRVVGGFFNQVCFVLHRGILRKVTPRDGDFAATHWPYQQVRGAAAVPRGAMVYHWCQTVLVGELRDIPLSMCTCMIYRKKYLLSLTLPHAPAHALLHTYARTRQLSLDGIFGGMASENVPSQTPSQDSFPSVPSNSGMHARTRTYICTHTQFPVGFVGGEERDVSLSPSFYSLYSSSALSLSGCQSTPSLR